MENRPAKTMQSLLILITLFFLGLPYGVSAEAAKKHKRQDPQPIPKKNIILHPDSEAVDEEGLRPEKEGQRRKKKKQTTEAPLPSDSDLCQEKHSIESFVQIASNGQPQGSPLGGLYFISDLREVPQLFHLPSPGQWPTQVTFFPDGVAYFALSPNGQKILAATHNGGDEQYTIYLLESAKKKVEPLLVDPNTRVESVAWGPGSSWFAYTSNARNKTDFDLYRYDLNQKKSELLAELKGFNNVTDVSPDGSKIAITNYRTVTDSDVLIWSFPLKQISRVSDKDGFYRGSGRFTADSKHLILISDEDKEMRQLVLADLLTTPPTLKPFAAGKWDFENLELDASRSFMAFTTNEDGYSKLGGYELDPNGRKKRMLLFPKLEGNQVSSLSFTRYQGRWALFFDRQSSTQNSDIFLWSHPKEMRWTQSSGNLVPKECLSPERLIRYPSFDGVEIPAFLFLPKAESIPTRFIVLAHGGPEGQYRPSFSKVFQYLLERGFGILAPNFRGSLGYGRTFTLMDNYKKRMDSVRDVVAGAQWLLANRYARTGELGIYGGSYGGFVVLSAIEMEPELFAAASDSVGIANFVTFLKNTKPYRRALREAEYGPLSDETFLKSISPIHAIDKIKTPLIIFHGANDPRVPVDEAEQLVAELKKRSIPVEYTLFSDEGHGNRKLRNIMEQAKKMVYFFEKHTKRSESP